MPEQENGIEVEEGDYDMLGMREIVAREQDELGTRVTFAGCGHKVWIALPIEMLPVGSRLVCGECLHEFHRKYAKWPM